MADIGLEFSSDSFKAFNATLKEFDSIAKKVDSKLATLALSVNNLLNAASSQNINEFVNFRTNFAQFMRDATALKTGNVSRLATAVSSVLKATSSYGVLQFEQFRETFQKFVRDMSVMSLGDMTKGTNALKHFFKELANFKPSSATKVIFELQYFFGNLAKIIQSLSKSTGTGRIDNFSKTIQAIRSLLKSFVTMGNLKLNKSQIVETLDFLRRFIFGKLNFGGIVGQIKRLGKIEASSVEGFSKIGHALASLISGLNQISTVKFNKEAVVQGLDFIRRFLFGSKFSSMFGRGGLQAIIKRVGSISEAQIKNFSRSMNALASMIKAIKDLDKLDLGGASVKKINQNIDAIMKIFGKFKGGIFIGGGGGGSGGGKSGGGFLSGLGSIIKGLAGFNLRFEGETRFLKRAFGDYLGIYKTFFKELIGLVPFGDKGFKLIGGMFLKAGHGLNNVLRNLISGFKGFGQKLGRAFRFPGFNNEAKRNIDKNFDKLENDFQARANTSKDRVQDILDGGFKLAFGSIALNATEKLAEAINPSNLIGAFVDFEDAFTGVVKTLDTSGLSETEAAQFIADLENDIRDMASEEGGVLSGLENAHVTIAGIAEAAGSLGIAREDIREFTETVGAMSLATNLSADEAADFFGQFGAITQSTEFDKIGATMVGLGNNFAATESQIADFGLRLAGAGEAAGLTEAEILGVGAAMASVGINAEAGGTAMTGIFNEMSKAAATMSGQTITGDQFIAQQNKNLENLAAKRQEAIENLAAAQDRLSRATTISGQETAGDSVEKATAELAKLDQAIANTQNSMVGVTSTTTITMNNASKELKTYAKIAGVSAQEFATMWEEDAVGALDLFTQGLGKLENAERIKVLDELGLDGARTADVLTRLGASGDNLTEAIRIANEEWANNSALMSEAEKRAATMRSSINRMKNNFFDLRVSIGEVFAPVFTRFINAITEATRKINKFIQENKEFITDFIGGLTDGIVKLLPFVGTFIGVLLMVSQVLPRISMGISHIMKGMKMLGLIMTSPVGLVAAFTALVIIPQIMKGIKDGTIDLEQIFKDLGTTLTNISNFFTDKWTDIKDNLLPAVRAAFDTVIEGVKLLFSGDAEQAFQKFSDALDKIKEGIQNTFKAFGGDQKKTFVLGEGLVNLEQNPIIASIETMFDAAKNKDWGVLVTELKNAIAAAISSVFTVVGVGEGGNLGFESDAIAEAARQAIIDAGQPDNFTDAVNRFIIGLRLAFYDIAQGDFEGVKNFLADHIAQVVRTAVTSVVGLVFGFPLGTLLSIANLVVSAIQSDFLGIRGILEQSSIGQSIIEFADGINVMIEDAFALVFGGGGKTTGITDEMMMEHIIVPNKSDGSFLQKLLAQFFTFDLGEMGGEGFSGFLDAIQEFSDSIVEIIGTIDISKLETFVLAISEAITTLSKGAFAAGIFLFQTFVAPMVTNFAESIATFLNSIDEEDVKGFVAGIAILKGIMLAPQIIAMAGVFALLGGVSKSIGDFGAALGDLFGALGLLLEGDPGGALEKIGDGITHLWNGIKNFVIGAVQPFIDLINKLLEVTGIEFRLIGVEQAFLTLETLVLGVVITIQRVLEDMFLKMEYQINDITIRLKQAQIDAGIGDTDTARSEVARLEAERNGLEQIFAIREKIERQTLGGGGLNLAEGFTFENWDGTVVAGQIADALNDPSVIENISSSTRTLLLNAAKKGLDSADPNQLADALSVFQSFGESIPDSLLPAPDQELITKNIQDYKDLLAAGFTNVKFEPGTLYFGNLNQYLADQVMLSASPENLAALGTELQTTISTFLSEGNFAGAIAVGNEIEQWKSLGIDVGAAIRTGMYEEFANTGMAGGLWDNFVGLIDLDAGNIQEQFNEQIALIASELGTEDALRIAEAVKFRLEDVVLQATGEDVNLEIDEEAIKNQTDAITLSNAQSFLGGLASGIQDMLGLGELTSTAEDMFSNLDNAFKTAAGIASPSQVFIDHGVALVDGLKAGIDQQMPLYQESIDSMKLKMTEFKDSVKLNVDEFSLFMTEIPLKMLEVALQFNNAVLMFMASSFILNLTFDSIALKIEGVNDKLSILAAYLADIGGSLSNLEIPGGTGDDPDGRALGGEISRGKIYEVLENNLPFEMFKTRGKTYFISNTDGMMLSPLMSNAIGASNSTNNYNETSGDVVMNFNIAGVDPQEVVRIARNEFDKVTKKQARRQGQNLKRGGTTDV